MSQYTVDEDSEEELLEVQKVSPSLLRFKLRNFEFDFGNLSDDPSLDNWGDDEALDSHCWYRVRFSVGVLTRFLVLFIISSTFVRDAARSDN